MKNKIFCNNDAEYQSFFVELVNQFTGSEPVSLDAEDFEVFRSFTGIVYVGEVELDPVRENATALATKEVISYIDDFQSATDVFIHIQGCSDIVDITTVNEATAVVYDIAPNATCILDINLVDTPVDKIKVMVLAKIP